MKFAELAIYLEKLDQTTSRNEMVEILSDLLKRSSSNEVGSMMYLLQGRVAPIYVNLELGMADKMVLRGITQAYDGSEGEMEKLFKKVGDVGLVAEQYAQKGSHTTGDLSVLEVFEMLKQIAEAGGSGSVDVKIGKLAGLFDNLNPLSVRYVARIPVGRLRLGFSDMTVLDSLSWMLDCTKNHRKEIERAFNVRPDLGFIVSRVKEKGIEGLRHVRPEVFNPILMARAERLSSGQEIIEKIGECAIEPKYDGFRLQVHKKGKEVKLFTRNLEEVTFMYPDVVEGVHKQITADEVIFEGEAIAYNPETGEYLPFQETVQRKRKYGIEAKAKEIPLKLISFDVLYVDGRNLLSTPYQNRRDILRHIIHTGETVFVSEVTIARDAKEIENTFDDAISRGLEGIVAKRLEGVYQAGARGWNWIKFKRSYSAHLDDTIDAVVMGYYAGRGKRTSFGLGAFLIGVYDEQQDIFQTVAKIGTGLTDDEWRFLFEKSNAIKAKGKPPLYEIDKMLTPDVWVEPEVVVEIKADEITRSPIHTAGRVMKPSKSGEAEDVDIPGYALRFPRLVQFRADRKPEDATTLKEIAEMYRSQGNNK